MLDSLDRKMLDSALVLLNIKPEELGFDKLWAADDTFRLAVVEKYLDDPYAFPGYVDETQTVIDSFSREPLEMLRFISNQLQVDPEAKPVRIPDSPDMTYDPVDPFHVWIDALKEAEPLRRQFYAGLDSLDLHDLIMAAPGLWCEEEDDSLKKLITGSWQREFNVQFDTSRDAGSDRILDIMKKLDRDALSQTGMLVIPAAQVTARGLTDNGFNGQAQTDEESVNRVGLTVIEGVKGEVLYHSETEWGSFIIGGSGDNVYYGDFAAILDLGGDDIYRGRCGGAIGELSHPYALIIDLEGNDYYDSRNKDVSHGSGFLGIGILIDRDGNDTYRSAAYAQGAGLFGIGVSVDHGGADDRRGGYFIQGVGHCGVGILIDDGDESSDDRYLSSCWSQGFASTFGYGLLFDDGGDDTYKAGGTYFHAPLLPHDYRSFSAGFGMGWRPRAGGGIGVLYDKGDGNDFYDQEVMSIGSSYWYSIGICIDGGGNDSYNLAHYGMGVGIHLSLGAFYEMDGDDQYHSRHGVVGATAHDFSVGLMVDGGGDDYYTVSDGWGGSLTNSYGLFIDRLGNDTYATRGKGYSFGKARWARGFGGVAIFLDLEGDDVYPDGIAAKDSSIWIQNGWGIGIDLPRNVPTEKEEPIGEITLTAEDSAKSITELYRLASQWEVGSARESVKRARKALLAKGAEAVKFIVNGPTQMSKNDISNLDAFLDKLVDPDNLISKYITEHFNHVTLELIDSYEETPTDPDSIKEVMADSLMMGLVEELNTILHSDNFYDKKRFANVEINEKLQKKLKDDLEDNNLFQRNWHLLEQAYPKEIVYHSGRLHTRSSLENRLLGQIVKAMPDTAGPLLLAKTPEAAEEEDPRILANTISLLGEIKWEPAVDPLLDMLDRKDKEKVRNTIIRTLGEIGEQRAAKPVSRYVTDDSEKRRIMTIGALGSISDSTTIEDVMKGLDDEVFTIRSMAMMTIAGFGTQTMPYLIEYIKQKGIRHPESGLYAIGRIARNLKDSTDTASMRIRYEAAQILERNLKTDVEYMRAEAVVGLYRIGGEETRAYINRLMENEFSPVVIAAWERMKAEMSK